MSQTLRTFTTAVALVDGLRARQQEDRLNRMRAKVSAITPKQPVRSYGVLTETDVSTQLTSEVSLMESNQVPTEVLWDLRHQFWDAVENDDVPTVQDMLEEFPEWKDKQGPDGTIGARKTPLVTAACFGNEKIVEYLVKNGADVNKQMSGGGNMTALMYAAKSISVNVRHNEKQYRAIVDLLLANGADPTLEDREGNTALQHARKKHGDHFKAIEKAIAEKMPKTDA